MLHLCLLRVSALVVGVAVQCLVCCTALQSSLTTRPGVLGQMWLGSLAYLPAVPSVSTSNLPTAHFQVLSVL